MRRLDPWSLACALTATALVLRLGRDGAARLPGSRALESALAQMGILASVLGRHLADAWLTFVGSHEFTTGLAVGAATALTSSTAIVPGLISAVPIGPGAGAPASSPR